MAGPNTLASLLMAIANSDHKAASDLLNAAAAEPGVRTTSPACGAGELVSMRRSSADGRDAYYRVDLVLDAGSCWRTPAEHSILGLPSSRPLAAASRSRGVRVSVLFLCTGNSARSQIAEALLEHLAGDAVDVHSAGSHPKRVHPNAVSAMRERGIDISCKRSQSRCAAFARRRFDYVVTLCDRVREVCPEFPGEPERIHWSIADPALEGDSERPKRYPAFQRTAAEIAEPHPILAPGDRAQQHNSRR